MYKPGDHVFYPKGGVFIIDQESNKHIAGRSISFFDLVSSDGKTRISIPKTNVSRVGVRKLISEKELEYHMDSWAPDLKICKLHHKNRKSRFEAFRQTGEFTDMSTVVVTIHYLINKTKATFEEKRMYDQIRKRMLDEIEIIRSLTSKDADDTLRDALDEAIKRKPIKSKDDEDMEDMDAYEAEEAVALT